MEKDIKIDQDRFTDQDRFQIIIPKDNALFGIEIPSGASPTSAYENAATLMLKLLELNNKKADRELAHIRDFEIKDHKTGNIYRHCNLYYDWRVYDASDNSLNEFFNWDRNANLENQPDKTYI